MIWSILKAPKVIAGIVFVVVIAGAGWYVISLQNERDALTESLVRQDEKITRLEASIDGLEKNIEIQEKTITRYLEETNEARQRQRQLASVLSRTSDELKQCLDKQLPPEVLDEIFNR